MPCALMQPSASHRQWLWQPCEPQRARIGLGLLLASSVTVLARARNHMRPPAEFKRLMIGLEPERLVIAFQARDIEKRARPGLAGDDLAGSDQRGDGSLRYV